MTQKLRPDSHSHTSLAKWLLALEVFHCDLSTLMWMDIFDVVIDKKSRPAKLRPIRFLSSRCIGFRMNDTSLNIVL